MSTNYISIASNTWSVLKLRWIYQVCNLFLFVQFHFGGSNKYFDFKILSAFFHDFKSIFLFLYLSIFISYNYKFIIKFVLLVETPSSCVNKIFDTDQKIRFVNILLMLETPRLFVTEIFKNKIGGFITTGYFEYQNLRYCKMLICV